jgi:carbonic anhydrase
MTTNNTSINISRQNVFGKCDLKCAYNFKYPETNLTANNYGSLIVFTLDKTNTPPVVYNEQKYSADVMFLVSPSIHIFNGSTTSAELIIIHKPALGGNSLLVSIPINQSTNSNAASNLVTDLIQSVANNAPVSGEKATINGFALNSIVPSKPFYSYTSKDVRETIDWIVFDILDAISLNSSIITSLTQIIKPYPLPTPGGNLFYNKNGPNQSTIGDGIYISCKPTGSSEEEVPVEYSKNSSSYDLFSGNNENTVKIILQFLFSAVILLIMIIGFSYGYSYFTGNPMPNFKTSLLKKNN